MSHRASEFAEMVDEELRIARAKHQRNLFSHHEAYGVVLEELDEVWDVVRSDGERAELLAELVQVAAMCRRWAEDLLLPYPGATSRLSGARGSIRIGEHDHPLIPSLQGGERPGEGAASSAPTADCPLTTAGDAEGGDQ